MYVSEVETCRDMLKHLGIATEWGRKTQHLLRCDYFGVNDDCRVIVEQKSTKNDLERAIPQIFRYYHQFFRLKWCKTPNVPMKLFIYYCIPDSKYTIRSLVVAKEFFAEYAQLYQKYMRNYDVPAINFCFDNKNDSITIYSDGVENIISDGNTINGKRLRKK